MLINILVAAVAVLACDGMGIIDKGDPVGVLIGLVAIFVYRGMVKETK